MVKKNYKFSLFTYSPLESEFQEYIESDKLQLFLKYVKKNSVMYILSYEKGNGLNVNHFHLFIEWKKPKRNDKIFSKDILKKYFSYNDYIDRLKIVFDTINIDTEHYRKYYIGYCLKESEKKFMLFEKEQQSYIDYYNKVANENELGQDKYRINRSNFHFKIYNFIRYNNLTCPKNDEDIAKVLNLMLGEDYYLPKVFSRKDIEEKCELACQYIRFKMNGEPITYYSDLLEEFKQYKNC